MTKRIFSIAAALVAALFSAGSADASTYTGTVNRSITVYGSPIIVSKYADMSLSIKSNATGKNTYADTDAEWSLTSPLIYTVSSDCNGTSASVTLSPTLNASASLSGNPANIQFVCRAASGSIPTTKTMGVDCSVFYNQNSSGETCNAVYFSFIPVSVTFGTANTAGTYSGAGTATLDYMTW
ncbi:hypothetical protein [Oryzomonas rubra]|uniref:Uncharacterized protein n=1 Tax=Oryzomonas rubra TaxID=2509454 RepID=A0A5A9X4L9_9BACT|nr:hypothetical protein [Oryzomonas rubra]KAA0888092.1 hypothetical protein ET418_16970 [Oryzomonas rubra]